MTTVFLTMVTRSEFQKLYILIIERECLIPFLEHFSVDIAFNMNLGALNNDFSKIYLFLPSITDRIEDVNRHMGSVNLSLIDITEGNFEVEGGVPFNPLKLDYENPDKQKMKEAVLIVLKKVVDLSNANIIKNVDGLYSKRYVEEDVEWVGETGKRVPENCYKLLYWILFLVFVAN